MLAIIILLVVGIALIKLGGFVLKLSEAHNEEKQKEEFYRETVTNNLIGINNAVNPTPERRDISKEFQKSVKDLEEKRNVRRAMKEELGVD